MTVTLDLPPDQYARLAELAGKENLPVEQWLGREVAGMLDRASAVDAAARYVLAKNAELYRRLAR
jgi:hypothetical protein